MTYTIFIVVLFLLGGSAAFAGFSAAPWLPTRKRERTALLSHINILPHHRVYDLGCGTGTLLFDLADTFPDATYIGYDISLLPLLLGNIRKLLHIKKYKNVSLRFGNLYRQSYKDADIVLAFLLDKAYKRLREKFAADLKDDCLVMIEAWPIKPLIPRDIVGDETTMPLFLYEGSQFREV